MVAVVRASTLSNGTFSSSVSSMLKLSTTVVSVCNSVELRLLKRHLQGHRGQNRTEPPGCDIPLPRHSEARTGLCRSTRRVCSCAMQKRSTFSSTLSAFLLFQHGAGQVGNMRRLFSDFQGTRAFGFNVSLDRLAQATAYEAVRPFRVPSARNKFPIAVP